MSAIFISHSSRDHAIASELQTRLAEEGHRSIFLDFDPANGIPAGRNWERELYSQLRRCRAVIAIISEHSLASQWCFAELTHARALGKYILPVRTDACLPSSVLHDVQSIEFTVDPALAYQRIFAALKGAGLDPADLFDWDGSRAPYPGFPAFLERDAAVFFGRGDETHQMLETLYRLLRLGGPRWVLVLGASGSGKSSLVRAGVVPRLKRDGDHWLVIDPFRPMRDPFEELAIRVAAAFPSHSARDWKGVRAALDVPPEPSNPNPLLELSRDLRVATNRPDATVLLIVDQLEELLHADNAAAADRFLSLLRSAADHPRNALVVIATLRSDFLGALQTRAATLGIDYESILLGAIQPSTFAEVIEGPARLVGLELEMGLVQAMVSDTVAQDALPLLAYTLRELWEKYANDGLLTVSEYADLGRLQGAVARAAEAIYREAKLSPEESRHLRQAFRALVRIDPEGQLARQPARWAELPPDVHPILERFVQARLLVSRGEGPERILDVAHEALFRSWDELKSWLDADRRLLVWRAQLRHDRQRWNAAAQDEGSLLRGRRLLEAEGWLADYGEDLTNDERDFIRASLGFRERERVARERLRLRLLVGLALVSVVFLVLAGVAARQAMNARARGRLAVSRELAAHATNQLDRDPELSVRLALLALDTAPTVQAEDALRRALTESRHLGTVSVETEVSSTGFSPDGRVLALATGRQIALADLKTREVRVLDGEVALLSDPVFSRDSSLIARGFANGTVRIWTVADGKEVRSFKVADSDAQKVEFSPDGKRLLTTHGLLTDLPPGHNPKDVFRESAVVRVWNVATGELLTALDHGGSVDTAGFDETGRYVLTAGSGDLAKIWNTDGLLHKTLAEHGGQVLAARFARDGRTVVTVGEDLTVKRWDSVTGARLASGGHPSLPVGLTDATGRHADISLSGSRVVIRSGDQLVAYETATCKEVGQLKDVPQSVHAAVFSDDERFVALGGEESTVFVWDLRAGRMFATLKGHQSGISAMTFSRDSSMLVTGSVDGTVRRWDMRTSDTPAVLPYRGAVTNLAWERNGKLLAIGGSGDVTDVVPVHVYDAAGTHIAELAAAGRVSSLSFSQDGKRLLAARYDSGGAHVWEIASATRLATLKGSGQQLEVLQLADFTPDEEIVIAGVGGRVLRWDARSGTRLSDIPSVPVTSSDPLGPPQVLLAYSRQSGFAVVATEAPNVSRVWNLRAATMVTELRGHVRPMETGISDDGKWIALWDGEKVEVWDSSTGRRHATLDVGWTMSLEFSRDGTLLATTGGQTSPHGKIWDVHAGKLRAELNGHANTIEHARFSPNGRLVVTASADNTVKVWFADSGRLITTFTGHLGMVFDALFSPDGSRILTASADGTARVFDCSLCIPLEELRAVAHKHPPRELTSRERTDFVQ
jgi:WD40 repeat protein